MRVNHLVTIRKCEGITRAGTKEAAGPRGNKEANDRLLPGGLRALAFAGLVLALCRLDPPWVATAATASSLAELQGSLPTHRATDVSSDPAASAKSPGSKASLPILTTAKAIHSLTRSQAQLHYPVHLRAVCVVCFADWYGFWAYDGVSGVYVQTKNHVPLTAAIHPGIVLDIEGFSGPGEYKPIVDQAVLQIVEERPLPPAPVVNLDRLSTGEYDGQWIAIEGTVRSAALQDGTLSLIVNAGRWQIDAVTVAAPKEKFERLIGARVRVSAAGGALVNKRRQAVFLAVYAPSIESIQVLKPAPSDPFSLPLTPIMRIVDFTPGSTPDDLIRVHGVVIARWGRSVFIHDGSQGASITSTEPTLLKPGELVDAVGYRSLDASTDALDDAIFKRLGTAPVPEPRFVTTKDASSGDFVDELVRIKGRLIEVQHEADKDTLLVTDGNRVFSAILPAEYRQEELAGLKNAREIQLTGVCLISERRSARNFWDPKVFQILLRSPADLVVDDGACVSSPGLCAGGHHGGSGLGGGAEKARRATDDSPPRKRRTIPPYGTARCFDRTGHTPLAPGPSGHGAGERQQTSQKVGGADGGPGSVQGDQRHPRPSGRRRSLASHGKPPSRRRAQRRYCLQAGRGRICCVAPRSERFPRAGENRRTDRGDVGGPHSPGGSDGAGFSQRWGLHRVRSGSRCG